MKKASLIVIALTIALITSLSFTAYQATQNSSQSSQQATKLEMVTLITRAQVEINSQLQILSANVAAASEKLTTTGMSGSQARQVLSELTQSSPCIIDVSTIDLQGKFVTVEPSNYSALEGKTTQFNYDMFAPSKDPIRTIMAGPYLLEEGVNASVIMAPVFNPNGAMIGSISLAFDQRSLINATATEVCKGTPYVIWVSDTEGTMIYEVNKSEEGTNIFTDAHTSSWASLQAFARHMVNETAGYGTYEYFNYDNTDRTVTKQAYWAAVGVYDAEWRIIITNVMR